MSICPGNVSVVVSEGFYGVCIAVCISSGFSLPGVSFGLIKVG